MSSDLILLHWRCLPFSRVYYWSQEHGIAKGQFYQKLLLPVKTKITKPFFSISIPTRSFAPFTSKSTFPFCCWYTCRSLFAVLYIHHEIQLQVGFDFLTPLDPICMLGQCLYISPKSSASAFTSIYYAFSTKLTCRGTVMFYLYVYICIL